MIRDLGGLWPVRPGSDPGLYWQLSGKLVPKKYSPAVLREIAVCLNTDGFELHHWCSLMGWSRNWTTWLGQLAEHYRDEVKADSYENLLSITREDGVDWLRAVLLRRPKFNGSVPRWTRNALRELRAEGKLKIPIMAKWASDAR